VRDFITCNVDILTDLDLDKLFAFHEKHKPLISFAVPTVRLQGIFYSIKTTGFADGETQKPARKE
jgi:NDP-sugar pyrophosphorylase family protein